MMPGRTARHIFMYNLVPPAYCTNGVGDIVVSGGVFDCEGKTFGDRPHKSL